MTEADWLSATEPGPLLRHLHDSGRIPPDRWWLKRLRAGLAPDWTGPGEGDRKRWLFALGCCRRVEKLLAGVLIPERSLAAGLLDPREALHRAERYLEGAAPDGPHPRNPRFYAAYTSAADHAVVAAGCAASDIFYDDPRGAVLASRSFIEPRGRDTGGAYLVGIESSLAVRRAVASLTAGVARGSGGEPEWHATWMKAYHDEAAVHAGLARCLFGNPFRPAPAVESGWLAWDGGTVPKLARAAYEAHAFDRLPVVADALEEAGCADAELLGHLRGPGPHVRGCFALDLLLVKE